MCVHAGLQLSSPIPPTPQIIRMRTDDILLLQHTVPITPKHKEPGGGGRQARRQDVWKSRPTCHRVCWSMETHNVDWLLQECGINPEHPPPPPLQVAQPAAPSTVTNLASTKSCSPPGVLSLEWPTTCPPPSRCTTLLLLKPHHRAGSLSPMPTILKHHYIIPLLPSPTQHGLQFRAGESLHISGAQMQTCCTRCLRHVEITAPRPPRWYGVSGRVSAVL
jgi:hypothetical protein